MSEPLRIGLDIGSTTIKCVVLNSSDEIIYSCYDRHYSLISQKTRELLTRLDKDVAHGAPVRLSISGSAGMGLALGSHIPFVQEVYATKVAADMYLPGTDVIIELGGEDAKILFLKGTLEVRMNGSCAGGTGAFIDQMATLLGITPAQMNEEAAKAERTYTIASRCGVFAKTDVQPLLNQGAKKSDVAASIFQAVVNQTLTGLVQGRKIRGKVMFLGGPLHYCRGLQKHFQETLKLPDEDALFPEYALYAVALGAAMCAENTPEVDLRGLLARIEAQPASQEHANRLPPLFRNAEEYHAFQARHARATVPTRDLAAYVGKAWLGVDCGSTTTKLALIAEDRSILYSY